MKKLILLLSITIFCFSACELSRSTTNKTNGKSKTANLNAAITDNSVATITDNSAVIDDTTKAPHVLQWEIDHPKMLNFIKDKNIDAKWLKSGLYYLILKEGSGEKPTMKSAVNVSYTISDLEDNEIWSTDEVEGKELRSLTNFPAGVAEGLQLIQAGGHIQLIVPSALGYSANGWGELIPPYTNLFYDIVLNEVE